MVPGNSASALVSLLVPGRGVVVNRAGQGGEVRSSSIGRAPPSY